MSSEPAFRAQLVIPEQRCLYDHWCRLAGDRRMPSRQDIVPGDLVQMLPNISLIDIAPELRDCRFRLAGTGLRNLFDREITGDCLGNVYRGEKQAYWLSICQRTIENVAPAQGAISAPLIGREHVVWFWMRLPLSGNGIRVDKILAHDVALPCHLEHNRNGRMAQIDAEAAARPQV